ncbi:hypothetical protein CDL12_11700 [Handroanthus impetiginosus]|uniref:EF-hand domain-containing protein n=1 Tax=Handroanthus impetiginosus TaxID=429701 RepID=A0A2G9HDQ0_9LAMI|nr:hypothetical protein CDL12_11700 [Handroanthus impetiginosus]
MEELREIAKAHYRASSPQVQALAREFFKLLDTNGNGKLDFVQVMTLYYIIKSGRPFCDSCNEFIPGIFFSCVECFKSPERLYNLCSDCYWYTKRDHHHNGRVQFLDNYTLLETKRDSSFARHHA